MIIIVGHRVQHAMMNLACPEELYNFSLWPFPPKTVRCPIQLTCISLNLLFRPVKEDIYTGTNRLTRNYLLFYVWGLTLRPKIKSWLIVCEVKLPANRTNSICGPWSISKAEPLLWASLSFWICQTFVVRELDVNLEISHHLSIERLNHFIFLIAEPGWCCSYCAVHI